MTAPREGISIVLPLIVGTMTTVVTILIHAVALRSILKFLRYQQRRGRTGAGFWTDLMIVTGAILVAFAAHLIEIAIWGFAFYRSGEFPDFAAALYHSAESYTTLGDEDLALSKAWQLLGPLEAADGMLMFGVTTAVIFAVIQRLLEIRIHSNAT
jgi:hypothetical protein